MRESWGEMADEEQVRKRIAKIAERRNNTTIDEIEWVINQLQQWYSTGAASCSPWGIVQSGKPTVYDQLS